MPYFKISGEVAQRKGSGAIEGVLAALAGVASILIAANMNSWAAFWIGVGITAIILMVGVGGKITLRKHQQKKGQLAYVLDYFTQYWTETLAKKKLDGVFKLKNYPEVVAQLGIVTEGYQGLYIEDDDGRQAALAQGKKLINDQLNALFQQREFERNHRRQALGIDVPPEIDPPTEATN